MRDRWRQALLEIFQAALDAVNGRRCVSAHLKTRRPTGPEYVIAIGKVACPMAGGALDVLGADIRDAVIITKQGHAEPLPWPVLEAAHPVPDASSLAAGAALLRFAATIPPHATVLVLLSGGASALVEQLPPGADLDTLRAMNEWLLATGRDIMAMNRIRKRLSLIKGGRMAGMLAPRRVICLAISDVPGDDPRFIGSGPLVADETIERESIDDAPASVREALLQAPPPPRADDPCFANVRFELVARLADAKNAAATAARSRGFDTTVHPEMVTGDAAAAGRRMAGALLAADAGVVHVWGGETTVHLPTNPGRGGRAQNLALAAACLLEGHNDTFLLAAGTDGSDGPTTDAGALVDGGTVERGTEAGFNTDTALRGADAGSFLEASGDLIQTGPTGTNVMDLMLGMRMQNNAKL
jgi:glycerate 2-kinase